MVRDLVQRLPVQVEDPANQSLEIQVRDSHLTGRPLLGDVSFPLSRLPADGALDAWLPVMDAQPLTAPAKPVGEIHLKFTYKVGCTAENFMASSSWMKLTSLLSEFQMLHCRFSRIVLHNYQVLFAIVKCLTCFCRHLRRTRQMQNTGKRRSWRWRCRRRQSQTSSPSHRHRPGQRLLPPPPPRLLLSPRCAVALSCQLCRVRTWQSPYRVAAL